MYDEARDVFKEDDRKGNIIDEILDKSTSGVVQSPALAEGVIVVKITL